ncbi:hypothetical protein D3C76_651560 [compost metagenome]
MGKTRLQTRQRQVDQASRIGERAGRRGNGRVFFKKLIERLFDRIQQRQLLFSRLGAHGGRSRVNAAVRPCAPASLGFSQQQVVIDQSPDVQGVVEQGVRVQHAFAFTVTAQRMAEVLPLFIHDVMHQASKHRADDGLTDDQPFVRLQTQKGAAFVQ